MRFPGIGWNLPLSFSAFPSSWAEYSSSAWPSTARNKSRLGSPPFSRYLSLLIRTTPGLVLVHFCNENRTAVVNSWHFTVKNHRKNHCPTSKVPHCAPDPTFTPPPLDRRPFSRVGGRSAGGIACGSYQNGKFGEIAAPGCISRRICGGCASIYAAGIAHSFGRCRGCCCRGATTALWRKGSKGGRLRWRQRGCIFRG